MKGNTEPFDDMFADAMKDPEFARLEQIEEMKLDMAESLTNARHEKKISQNTLAHKANVSRRTIAKIEKGKDNISVDTIFKVASTLGKKMSVRFE